MKRFDIEKEKNIRNAYGRLSVIPTKKLTEDLGKSYFDDEELEEIKQSTRKQETDQKINSLITQV